MGRPLGGPVTSTRIRNPGGQGGPPLHDSVFLSTLWNPPLSTVCSPPPTPTLELYLFYRKFLPPVQKKIIQPLDITLLSKQGLFFFFFSSAHKRKFPHLVFRRHTSSLQCQRCSPGGWHWCCGAGALGRSVGVHAVSLVIPRALL